MNLSLGLRPLFITLCLSVLVVTATVCRADSLPLPLMSALINKITLFESNLSKREKVSIFVLGDEKLYSSLAQLKEHPKSRLAELKYGSRVPDKHFDVLYVGSSEQLETALEYAYVFKSLLIAGELELVEDGVPLGILLHEGRPKFFVNLQASKYYGLKWQSRLLKIARWVK